MSIRYDHGDLLSAPVEAVVNTVNTRGVMGKGIALQVKQRWPEVERAYRAACRRGEVVLGSMQVVERGGLGDGPKFVINFPTKDHWRSRSKPPDIVSGLDDLRTVIEKLGIGSVAIPPLGCGNGGLEWSDVQPLIEAALTDLGAVDVVVFPPEGRTCRRTQTMVGPNRPAMTPTLAGMVRLIDGYWTDVVGITDIELEKLVYFLGARRSALRLRFAKGPDGPYCEPLHHVLQRGRGSLPPGLRRSQPTAVGARAARGTAGSGRRRRRSHPVRGRLRVGSRRSAEPRRGIRRRMGPRAPQHRPLGR